MGTEETFCTTDRNRFVTPLAANYLPRIHPCAVAPEIPANTVRMSHQNNPPKRVEPEVFPPIDITVTANKVGILCRTVITRAAWQVCTDLPTDSPPEPGGIFDACWMLRCAISDLTAASTQYHPGGECMTFPLLTQTCGEEIPTLRQLKAVIVPDPVGKPLITISLPTEVSHV